MKWKMLTIGIIGFTLILSSLIFLVVWLASEPKEEKPKNKTTFEITDPKKAVAQMQKRLGSGWQKIEMIQGKWYGPHKMRNGSDWQIAIGEVWIKVDKQRPFLDRPNTNPFVSGKEIKFSSATNTAVLFFNY